MTTMSDKGSTLAPLPGHASFLSAYYTARITDRRQNNGGTDGRQSHSGWVSCVVHRLPLPGAGEQYGTRPAIPGAEIELADPDLTGAIQGRARTQEHIQSQVLRWR